jgi:hypothetical protein
LLQDQTTHPVISSGNELLRLFFPSHYLAQDLIFAGAAAIWGVIAVGLFADNPEPLDTTSGRSGLFKGKSPSWLTGQISFLRLCSMWQLAVYGITWLLPNFTIQKAKPNRHFILI